MHAVRRIVCRYAGRPQLRHHFENDTMSGHKEDLFHINEFATILIMVCFINDANTFICVCERFFAFSTVFFFCRGSNESAAFILMDVGISIYPPHSAFVIINFLAETLTFANADERPMANTHNSHNTKNIAVTAINIWAEIMGSSALPQRVAKWIISIKKWWKSDWDFLSLPQFHSSDRFCNTISYNIFFLLFIGLSSAAFHYHIGYLRTKIIFKYS